MPINLATAAAALAVTAAVVGGAQACDIPTSGPGAIDWPAAPKPAAVQQGGRNLSPEQMADLHKRNPDLDPGEANDIYRALTDDNPGPEVHRPAGTPGAKTQFTYYDSPPARAA